MHSWVWFLSSQRGLNSKGSSFLARWRRKLKTKLEKLSPLRGIGFAGLPKVTGAKSKSGRDCRKEMEGGRLEMFDPAPGLASWGILAQTQKWRWEGAAHLLQQQESPSQHLLLVYRAAPSCSPPPQAATPSVGHRNPTLSTSVPLQEACVRGKQKESSLPTAQECFCWAEASP